MKERVTYDEFAMFEFYMMLSLIVFSPLKVRKFSNNYVLEHCVHWNKRKRVMLLIIHVHMTIYTFFFADFNLFNCLTNQSITSADFVC